MRLVSEAGQRGWAAWRVREESQGGGADGRVRGGGQGGWVVGRDTAEGQRRRSESAGRAYAQLSRVVRTPEGW